MTTSAAPQRLAWMDHLRVLLTILVILHHCAIAYGGSGGWYYREVKEGSVLPLIIFNAVNQSYFMGFFFLLAGYLAPGSIARKGWGGFWADRLPRLAVPLFCYFFVLSPLTIAIAYPVEGQAFLSRFWDVAQSPKAWGPGPLWFCEALLLFAAAHWLLARRTPLSSAKSLPSVKGFVIAGVVLGAIAFVVRIWIPVGHEVLWLQLGYFPCYVALYFGGVVAAEKRLLSQVPGKRALIWLLGSAVTFATLPLMISLAPSLGDFHGGLNPIALFYAMWDPFMAIGIIMGLLWLAHRLGTWGADVSRVLGQQTFGAFIVHPPVLVAASQFLKTWQAAPFVKFAGVGALAVAGSFVVSAALRALPRVRRIL